MGFDELTAAIQDRIDVYWRTGDAQVLLTDAVQSEVDALLGAVEPEDPAALPPADRQRVAEAHRLVGTLFFLRFERTPEPAGDLGDLARALLFHWPGFSVSAGDPPRPLRVLLPGPDSDVRVQLDAALALARHALVSSDGLSLRVTIALLDDVVAAMPPWHRELPVRVARLLDATVLWHRMTGDPQAADQVIGLSRQWLDSLPADHPDRWVFLAAVALVYAGKVQHGGLGAVRDAIEIGEQALVAYEGTSRGAPDHFPYEAAAGMISFATQLRIGLGSTYELRYRLSLAPSDLDRCVALREKAATDLNWRDPGVVAAVSEGHLARFDRTGELPDLRRAVAAARRFLAIDDVAAIDEPANDLATALVATAHLVPSGERFHPMTPPPDTTRGGFLKRLWLERLVPSENSEPDRDWDGDAVIVLGERALTVTGFAIAIDESPTVPWPEDPATDRTLVRLSAAYVHRFTQLGDKADIDRAVALIELTRSLDQADDLGHAARAHQVRFAVSQSVRDLEAAISLFERALEKMDDDRDRLWAAYNLADAYRTAEGVSGDEDYLRRATTLCEQTLAGGPADDPARAPLLVVLADNHRQRFSRSGDRHHLERAMDLYRQAVALDRDAGTLGSLGNAHLGRFTALEDPADLLAALGYFREALAMTPENSVIRAFGVARYCRTYSNLHAVSPQAVNAGDLTMLVDLCARSSHGLPVHRAAAWHAVGSLALAMDQPRIAVHVLDQAVDLLRTAAWRDTDWPAQETYLREIRDLASDSVAAHLAIGHPVAAVEAAERGRALTLGSELDIRADVADLSRIHPPLAQRLDEVRDRLNTRFEYDLVNTLRDTVGRDNRTHLWAEHDRLVEEVRQLPGFAGFLGLPNLAELRPAAEGGAVVLVNASRTRSDAVIVTSDSDPVLVPLPGLTTDDLATHASALLRAVTASPLTRSLRARRVLTDILGWLWETTVEPVLAAVTRIQAEPRIWWLPIGTLGLFPLHAAGVDGRPGALDLAVSSYIPTLRALHHARRRARPAARRQLTVALPHTPGFPPIPGTTAEATALRARYPDHPFLTGADATPSKVMATLTECTWAHFACHASADTATSARAALLLHGGELPVEAISRLRLDAAELAYLSACSTATRGLDADEPTNLASAFHLAGFRHVVATLWPLTDTTAALAAQTFYNTLGNTTTADNTAHTVRAVARELRSRNPNRPDLWAALIHSGP